MPSSLTTVQPSPKHPRQLLASSELADLNQRSNLSGGLRLAGHLAVAISAGCLWNSAEGWIKFAGLLVYGASLALMFCPTHECAHRTAFSNSRLNDAVGWVTGLLSFYNSTFYRRYHVWHHRYTQIAGKDPELDDPQPETLAQYLWQLSGIPWWRGKISGHLKVALGQVEDYPFLPVQAREETIRSTRLQLGVYAAVVLVSAALGHPEFLFMNWILPLAVGQPLLRFILFAEHHGCSRSNDALSNTRTTLTLWPLRYLMWNLSYHAEHHLYPSIPFHALPLAHQRLQGSFTHVEAGYCRVNRNLIRSLG